MADCRQYLVSGRVQGVGFRYATRTRATELGLSGYAENLPDGRVEVLACGNSSSLDELEAWLQSGPPAARVRDVAVSRSEPGEIPAGFSIR